MITPDNAIDTRALLAFYAEAGVDEALDEAPVNRFAEAAPQPSPPAAAQPAAARAAAVPIAPAAPRPAQAAVPDEAQAALARQLAAGAATLEELREAMASFDGCNLKFTAKNLVFSDGNPEAALMLVGEAPGRDEDIEGRPFVGRSGRLLDRMLAAIGLDRSSVYIANVVPWRPPGNRTPTPQETAMCLPFIRRQIELVGPDYLVCLGAASTQTLLGVKDGILRARGRMYEYELGPGEPRNIRAFAMLHPAYLLRQPLHKKQAWADLRALKKAVDG